MLKKSLIVAAALTMSAGFAFAQDLAAGATSYKKCAPCHDVGPTAKNKLGPQLNDLDGRKTGTVAGYNYSDANKKAEIVWSEATFVDYIKDPKGKMPGTKMVFVGIKDETEAKNLWAHIKQFGPDGKPK